MGVTRKALQFQMSSRKITAMEETMRKLLLALIALTICASQAMAQHRVDLTWLPSPDGAANPTSGYNVLRGTAPGAESSTPINGAVVAAGCTNTSTCKYSDTSSAVVAGAVLYYEVLFVVGSKSSPPSNEATPGPIPIGSPTNLTATGS
jgi:hypothetical protein